MALLTRWITAVELAELETGHHTTTVRDGGTDCSVGLVSRDLHLVNRAITKLFDALTH